jgi:hypothetical protein
MTWSTEFRSDRFPRGFPLDFHLHSSWRLSEQFNVAVTDWHLGRITFYHNSRFPSYSLACKE